MKTFSPTFARGVLGALALAAAWAPLAAQPQLGTSVRGYGFAIDPNGPTVGTGYANVSMTRSWDSYFEGGRLWEPSFSGEAWAQASTAGGGVALSGEARMRGQDLPMLASNDQLGFRLNASYSDDWTVQVAGVPIGATLYLRPIVRVEVEIRYPFAPDVMEVLLPENFFPQPQLPLGELSVIFSLGVLGGQGGFVNTQYGGVLARQPGGLLVASNYLDPRGFRFENGRAFEMSLGFLGGYLPTGSEISAGLADPAAPWSLAVVYNAAHTVAYGGLEIVDAAGRSYGTYSVTDSLGAAVVPASSAIPEPGAITALAGVFVLAAAALRRRRRGGS